MAPKKASSRGSSASASRSKSASRASSSNYRGTDIIRNAAEAQTEYAILESMNVPRPIRHAVRAKALLGSGGGDLIDAVTNAAVVNAVMSKSHSNQRCIPFGNVDENYIFDTSSNSFYYERPGDHFSDSPRVFTTYRGGNPREPRYQNNEYYAYPPPPPAPAPAQQAIVPAPAQQAIVPAQTQQATETSIVSSENNEFRSLLKEFILSQAQTNKSLAEGHTKIIESLKETQDELKKTNNRVKHNDDRFAAMEEQIKYFHRRLDDRSGAFSNFDHDSISQVQSEIPRSVASSRQRSQFNPPSVASYRQRSVAALRQQFEAGSQANSVRSSRPVHEREMTAEEQYYADQAELDPLPDLPLAPHERAHVMHHLVSQKPRQVDRANDSETTDYE